MDRPHYQLFPDPGLSGDQYVELGTGNDADFLLELLHHRRKPDDFIIFSRGASPRRGQRRQRLSLQRFDQ
ncbi:hypothetical protein D3C80_1923160 [compost metagenome]